MTGQITLKDIDKAITQLLTNKFPNVEVQESDVKEGFARPSFFITYDNISNDGRIHINEKQLTVRIFYFPSDRYVYQLEVIEMIEQLEQMFRLNFTVADRIITVDESRSQVIDGILEFEFDFTYHTANQIQETDTKMEELKLYVV